MNPVIKTLIKEFNTKLKSIQARHAEKGHPDHFYSWNEGIIHQLKQDIARLKELRYEA